MAASVQFSLVSPERELFSGDALSILVPGAEGLFEVQAGHAPVMSTLSPGMLEIRQTGGVQQFFVRGGFADVTAEGLTVLAEIAIPSAELKGDVLSDEKDAATAILNDAAAAPDQQLNAQRALAVLDAA